MLNNKQLITIVFGTCLLSLVGCGGGTDNSTAPAPNNTVPQNNTTALPVVAPSTATTVAASGHDFRMFSEQAVMLENSSLAPITLVILDTAEFVMLKKVLDPMTSISVDLKTPQSKAGYAVIWSGYDQNIDNYNSIQSNLTRLPDSLVFTAFAQ